MIPKHICRECGGVAHPSKGLMNYHNIRYPLDNSKAEFETVYENCFKCGSCGHSWIPAGKFKHIGIGDEACKINPVKEELRNSN